MASGGTSVITTDCAADHSAPSDQAGQDHRPATDPHVVVDDDRVGRVGARNEVRMVDVVTASNDVRVAGNDHVVADCDSRPGVEQAPKTDRDAVADHDVGICQTVVPRLIAEPLPIVAPHRRSNPAG